MNFYTKDEFDNIISKLTKWQYYINKDKIIISNGFIRQEFGTINDNIITSKYNIIEIYDNYCILKDFLNLNNIFIEWSWFGYFIGNKDDPDITFALVNHSMKSKDNCTIFDIIDYLKHRLCLNIKLYNYNGNT